MLALKSACTNIAIARRRWMVVIKIKATMEIGSTLRSPDSGGIAVSAGQKPHSIVANRMD